MQRNLTRKERRLMKANIFLCILLAILLTILINDIYGYPQDFIDCDHCGMICEPFEEPIYCSGGQWNCEWGTDCNCWVRVWQAYDSDRESGCLIMTLKR